MNIEGAKKLEKMIIDINNNYETRYEIVYGDSVTGYTPIIIKHNNYIKTI